MEKRYSSYTRLRKAIDAGTESCVSLVQYYLGRIEATRQLNSYVEVYTQEALARAEALDQKPIEDRGRLFGMVIGIKDVLCYAGHEVNAASKMLEGFESLFTGTALQRLIDEDAIIIGRLNCDEFAMGSANENSVHGPVRNALDESRVPGGSSGGSAVAVQTDTCLVALGSDTGGSVRQPAAFCGIVGYKPTYGRISRYGLIAYASSFDQIGPFTHSVEDAALALEIMAGPDAYDATASTMPVASYSQTLDFPQKARIAYLETALQYEAVDATLRTETMALVERLKADGHTVEPISIDYLDYAIPTYYVLTTAEASSNLARYDGIHFGYRNDELDENSPFPPLEQIYRKTRTTGFGKEVKRRIMLGTFVLSAGYYDAYYTKAQKVRRLIQQELDDILKDYDFIMLPTAPTVAFKLGEKITNPVERYLSDIFTAQANLAGTPAISLPFAQNAEGLPFGIQFMANRFEDGKLLAFSKHVQDNYIVQ